MLVARSGFSLPPASGNAMEVRAVEALRLRYGDAPAVSVEAIEAANLGLGVYGVRNGVAPLLWRHPSVTSLDLRSNALGDEGVRELVDVLVHAEALKELNVCDNRLGAAGLRGLATLLRGGRPRLRSLDLSFNEFKHVEDVRYLFAAMCRDGGIQRLALEHCNVTAEMMPALEEVCDTCPLRLLRVTFSSGVPIAGMLRALHRRGTIQELYLRDTAAPPDVAEAAQELTAILVDPVCRLLHLNVPQISLDAAQLVDSYSLLTYRGGFLGDTSHFTSILERNYQQRFAMQRWSPSSHIVFPPAARRAIETLMLIRRVEDTPLSAMPIEIMQEILVRSAFYGPAEDASTAPEPSAPLGQLCRIL